MKDIAALCAILSGKGKGRKRMFIIDGEEFSSLFSGLEPSSLRRWLPDLEKK